MYVKTSGRPDRKFDAAQAFITNIVGAPERVEALQANLRQEVRIGREKLEAQQGKRPGWVHVGGKINPYETVFEGIRGQFEATRKKYVPYHDFSSNPMAQAIYSAEQNGLSGITVALMALNGLGEVYAKHATYPQTRSRVACSVGKTLRTVQLIAFNDTRIGRRNVSAMMVGTNPKRRLRTAIRMRSTGGNVGAGIPLDERSFTIGDTDGQLVVSPRFMPLRTSKEGAGCPATATRIESEGRTLPGLHTLLHAVGEVVLDEIYPYQFDISPNE